MVRPSQGGGQTQGTDCPVHLHSRLSIPVDGFPCPCTFCSYLDVTRLPRACGWSRQSKAQLFPPDHQPVFARVATKSASTGETQTLAGHAYHPEQLKAIPSPLSPRHQLTPVAIVMRFLIVGTVHVLAFQPIQLWCLVSSGEREWRQTRLPHLEQVF
eukprot:3937780-Rhodomonas_salina.1